MNSVISRLAGILVITGSIAGIAILTAAPAQSQLSVAKNYVALQSGSAGGLTTQSGSMAISGTARMSGLLVEGATGSCIIEGINASNLANSAGVCGHATATTGATFGVVGTSASNAGIGGYFLASSATGNTYGVLAGNNSSTGTGIFAFGTLRGGHLRTVGTSGTGVFGEAVSTGQTRGVYGLSSGTSGPNYGVYGESAGTFGSGVFGANTRTSGTVYGGRFEVNSPDGRAVRGSSNATTGLGYGGYFESASDSGIGVYAKAGQQLGFAYGVWGETASRTLSAGVFGLATDTTTSDNIGVRGEARGSDAMGVFGFAPRTTGLTKGVRGVTDSNAGIGVLGQARATTGTIYGVLGQEATAAAGFGVYAVGDSGASGVKAFRIDDPRDPENYYLMHFSSESPTPQNFYSGNVTTDEKGYAWVDLPDYFEEINANLKYQLTVVDDGDRTDFVQVKVSQKARGNRFQIRTSAPGVEVSWRIEADRNDPYVRANPTKDRVMKEGLERGTVLHPDLYGMPKGKAMVKDEVAKTPVRPSTRND